jgi:hypothetical protein
MPPDALLISTHTPSVASTRVSISSRHLAVC